MNHLDFNLVKGIDISNLVSAKTREDRYLDYKRELPGSGNDAKKEFLADVTSFANSSGGAIVFGVSEEKDSGGKNTGIPEAIVGLSGVNIDMAKSRLEQWLQTGVDPRLPAARFHVVETSPGVELLILVLKKSWFGPHMVAVADSRFYTRTSTGKCALDAMEIRTAFLQAEEVPSRLRRLRDERLALVAAGETPVRLRDGGRLVLHILPFSALGRGAPVDLHAWAELSPGSLDGSLSGRHFNADGHVGYVGDEKTGHTNYVQLLRSGAVEAVALCNHKDTRGLPVLNIWSTQAEIVDGLQRYLPALSSSGVEMPLSISLSLLGGKGFGLPFSTRRNLGGNPFVTGDVVALPDVVLDELEADLPTALRPVFDALWQTFGLAKSLCYNDSGIWNRDFRW